MKWDVKQKAIPLGTVENSKNKWILNLSKQKYGRWMVSRMVNHIWILFFCYAEMSLKEKERDGMASIGYIQNGSKRKNWLNSWIEEKRDEIEHYCMRWKDTNVYKQMVKFSANKQKKIYSIIAWWMRSFWRALVFVVGLSTKPRQRKKNKLLHCKHC